MSKLVTAARSGPGIHFLVLSRGEYRVPMVGDIISSTNEPDYRGPVVYYEDTEKGLKDAQAHFELARQWYIQQPAMLALQLTRVILQVNSYNTRGQRVVVLASLKDATSRLQSKIITQCGGGEEEKMKSVLAPPPPPPSSRRRMNEIIEQARINGTEEDVSDQSAETVAYISSCFAASSSPSKRPVFIPSQIAAIRRLMSKLDDPDQEPNASLFEVVPKSFMSTVRNIINVSDYSKTTPVPVNNKQCTIPPPPSSTHQQSLARFIRWLFEIVIIEIGKYGFFNVRDCGGGGDQCDLCPDESSPRALVNIEYNIVNGEVGYTSLSSMCYECVTITFDKTVGVWPTLHITDMKPDDQFLVLHISLIHEEYSFADDKYPTPTRLRLLAVYSGGTVEPHFGCGEINEYLHAPDTVEHAVFPYMSPPQFKVLSVIKDNVTSKVEASELDMYVHFDRRQKQQNDRKSPRVEDDGTEDEQKEQVSSKRSKQ